MIVASGFSFRVIYGSDITDIETSPWAVSMAYFLALLLVISKRRSELIQDYGEGSRPVLRTYNRSFLDLVLALTGCIVIVCYIMYTLADRTVMIYGSNYVYVTSFFVIGGIFRYLQLTFSDVDTQSPTDILYKDRIIQIFITFWAITLLFLRYSGNFFPI